MPKREIKSNNRGLFTSIKSKIRNYMTGQSSTSIIIIYNLITIILIAAFYPIIPTLLNYPPNNEEVSAALGTSNILQYFIVAIYSCSVGTIFLYKSLKSFKRWEVLDKNNEKDIKIISEIRKKSINLPIFIFILQIAILNIPTLLILVIVATLNNVPKMAIARVMIITISLSSLAAVSTYIFSKRTFKAVLLKTYFGQKPEGIRVSLKKSIFIQIVPMLVVAILLTTLAGYSRLITEKADLMYGIYKNMLAERLNNVDNIKNTNDALEILKEVRYDESTPLYFVKAPDGSIATSDRSVLGGYFLYYLSKPYHGDRMFDLNAGTQGIVMAVNGQDGEWKLGLIFQVASSKTIDFFFIGFIALLLLNVIVLYYFVTSLSSDISHVAEGLMDIANGENVDLEKKLPVTSNDEIADLVVAFNKIQEREKERIKEMKQQQEIIMEQERIVSLQKSEERYRTLIEMLPDAVIISVEGRVVFANLEGVKISGVGNLEDLIDQKIEDFIFPEYIGSVKEVGEQLSSNSGPIRLSELRLIRVDGSVIDVEATTIPFVFGESLGALSVVRDITEQKQAEKLKNKIEEKNKLLKEAEEIDRLKTEFFANISHELRTPLNVILGVIQLMGFNLRKNLELNTADLQKHMKIMKQNCRRLLRLINNLIDSTKIDTGYFEVNLKNRNIVNVVEEITLSVAEYIESKGIQLEFDTDTEEKIIACDADKIERIMLNLLSNSIKFTPVGGKIRVNMYDKQHRIIISVKDTGIGIAQEKLNVIFDRFRQVDNLLTRNHEGSGIGLSLVKSLVEMNGGEITVISETGKGSEFIITLPVKTLPEQDPMIQKDNSMQQNRIEKIELEFSDIYS